MNQNQIIQDYESKYLKEKVPAFQIGDTIKVHTRIVEGQKERIQVFTGTVIARKGSGLSESFTVYRNAYGSSMERVFLLNSPKIAKIEVVRKGKVRRAKLNYIRGESGKAAKIKEMIGSKTKKIEEKESETEVPKEVSDTQAETKTSEE